MFFVAVLALSLSFTSCEDDNFFSSVNKLRFCEAVNSNSQCDSNTSFFSPNTPEISASVVIENATPDHLVTFVWTYLDTDIEIDAVTYSLSNLGVSDSYSVSSFLTIPNNGWPTGTYSVEVFLDDADSIGDSRERTGFI